MANEKKQFLDRWFHREVTGKQGPAVAGEQKEEFITEIRPSQRKHSSLRQTLHFSFAVLIMLVILALVAAVLVYFLQVRSVNAVKESLDKPTLTAENNIQKEHVASLLNELGVYRLHRSFLDGKTPLVLIWITNTGQKFRATVRDNLVTVEEGDADDYDIIVSLEEKVFREVYAAEDPVAMSKEKIERKRIGIDKNDKDLRLALRGYAAFKETIIPPQTALFFFTTGQLKAIYLVVVILLLLFTIWYFRHV